MIFFKRIFGRKKAENTYEPIITLEKIQHVFEYGKLNDVAEMGDESLSELKVGHSIRWKSEEYCDTPAHIEWSNKPIFAYVSIVNKKIQYHWSGNGGSTICVCPVTTDPVHIKHIDEIFEHYYHKVFKLPDSLNEIKQEKACKADAMKFLEEYLITQDDDFFINNFHDDDDIYDIAMWVDWREEDENIITDCESILKTGELSVETSTVGNERGFEIVITYKGKQTIIPYKGVADRETTLKTLNKVINPDYEIRFCIESDGSDMLCFIPLRKNKWLELEMKFSKEMGEKFKKIEDTSNLF